MPGRTEFFAGVRAELPLMLGVVPFGLIYGVLARGAGIPPGAAVAMSSIIFAGSAQFIATQLFASAAPGFILLLTTLIVNVRHMLYSASVAPFLPFRPAWRWLLAYFLTDEVYAVVITRYSVRSDRDAYRHWFFLGAGVTLWVSWNLSTAVGVYLGAVVPSGWNLEFLLTLIFIAIVVPMLTDRPTVAAAVVGGTIAAAAAALPLRLGLMMGALAGIVAGVLVDRWRAAPRTVKTA